MFFTYNWQLCTPFLFFTKVTSLILIRLFPNDYAGRQESQFHVICELVESEKLAGCKCIRRIAYAAGAEVNASLKYVPCDDPMSALNSVLDFTCYFTVRGSQQFPLGRGITNGIAKITTNFTSLPVTNIIVLS